MVTRKKIGLIAPLALVFTLLTQLAHAQDGFGIPATYPVVGEGVESGDIISYDPARGVYAPSASAYDENVFGVVDEAPAVVFRGSEDGVPIVRVGQVIVNVNDLGGSISVGDAITTSGVAGQGMRASKGDGLIIGYAMDSFVSGSVSSSTETTASGEAGKIRVSMDIGYSTASSGSTGTDRASTIFVRDDTVNVDSGLETVFRYAAALVFALGTVFVVLKTFGPNIGRGVLSMGRNPLAKKSIQGMIIFNFILILSITIVAFIVSLLIIFIPI